MASSRVPSAWYLFLASISALIGMSVARYSLGARNAGRAAASQVVDGWGAGGANARDWAAKSATTANWAWGLTGCAAVLLALGWFAAVRELGPAGARRGVLLARLFLFTAPGLGMAVVAALTLTVF